MKNLLTGVSHFIRSEEGATAVEYGLLVALISVAIITAARTLGSNLSAVFNTVASTLGNVELRP